MKERILNRQDAKTPRLESFLLDVLASWRFKPLLFLIIFLLSSIALAGSLPNERLSNPLLEARADSIFVQLRCLVCQNETIADSDARIAHDLRLLVRTRLLQGDTNQQILDFIHSRYGDFVLMKPPLNASTGALWFGPIIILLIGGWVVASVMRRQRITS